jgi:hypothetical protein
MSVSSCGYARPGHWSHRRRDEFATDFPLAARIPFDYHLVPTEVVDHGFEEVAGDVLLAIEKAIASLIHTAYIGAMAESRYG